MEDGEFGVVGSDDKWLLSVVASAMERLYELTGEASFDSAISVGKLYAENEDDSEQVALLAVFFRKEMSGDLKPPPSLRAMYSKIVKMVDQNS